METLVSVNTRENISTVENAFSNFLKGDIGGIIDACSDDVVWGAHRNPGVPYAKTFHRKQGVREFFEAIAGSIDFVEFKPEEYFADGDRVFVKGHHKATVKATGKTFDHDFLMEFIVREGKMSYYFAWLDSLDQAAAFSR